MTRLLSLVLLFTALSGCAYFQIHKQEVEQGNVISENNVSLLHRGMSKERVEDIMGTPLLVNLFSPGRVEYIYTIQKAHQERQTKRVSCLFVNGRLQEITTH